MKEGKEVTVVGAVIQGEQKRILCALRSPAMTLPHYWEFPGGKIEKGESQEEALIREIQEELGCLIAVYEKITTATHQYDHIKVQLTTYWCKIKSGNPIAKEHARLEWMAIDQLADLNWAPADLPTIQIIKNQKGRML